MWGKLTSQTRLHFLFMCTFENLQSVMSFIVVKRPKKNRERAATLIVRAKNNWLEVIYLLNLIHFSPLKLSANRDYDIYLILISWNSIIINNLANIFVDSSETWIRHKIFQILKLLTGLVCHMIFYLLFDLQINQSF